jgi:hypothetical protein
LISFQTFRCPLFPKLVSQYALFCRFLQQDSSSWIELNRLGFLTDFVLKPLKKTTLWNSWLINCATEYVVGRREKHSWWRVYSLQIDSNQPLSRFLLGLLCMSVSNSFTVLKFSALKSTKAIAISGVLLSTHSQWLILIAYSTIFEKILLRSQRWQIISMFFCE